jgi:chromosome segregation ATPase
MASEDIVELLQKIKEEHAERSTAIELLESQQSAGAWRLGESHEVIRRVESEISDIREKTVVSAGGARQLDEVLDAERAESAALQAEIRRLDEELNASLCTLEELQMQSTESSFEMLATLDTLRCAWKKRCRSNHSKVVSLACTLAVLEMDAEEGPPKRTCSCTETTTQ